MGGIGGYVRRCERKHMPELRLYTNARQWPYGSFEWPYGSFEVTWQTKIPALRFERFDVDSDDSAGIG